MAIVEKVNQSDLILYEVLRNPVLCGEFIHNFDNSEYDDEWKYSFYQSEFLCDFNSYVDVCQARATGKTVALSDLLTWLLINNIFPDDYIVYTVPSKVHLEPVFTNLTRMFRSNTFLKQFIAPTTGINRSDYIIKLKNEATLMCRIAGQSGTGANVIGLHAPIVVLDEGGYYPWGTWVELQPILNTFTQGFRMIVAGVPTGLREQNVLYHTDMENSNYTKHRVSAYDNPRFTKEDEARAIEQYGNKESDDFIHLVLGEHGAPIFAVFDRRLMEIKSYPVYRLVLNGIDLKDDLAQYHTKLSLLPVVPEGVKTLMGVDLGYCYSEDTEVLTKRGWLKHKDITIKDIIACFDTKKDQIVWDNPIYLWEQDYKGEMLEFNGKSTNFMVSPEHSVWIRKYNGSKPNKYEKLKAKDLLTLKNKFFKVKLTAKSEKQTGLKTFKVPYYYCKRKDRLEKNTEIKIGIWLQFLAWFISEGSATANRSWEINLTQAENRYSKEIDKVLNQLPYKFHRKEFITPLSNKQIQWQITCKELCLWLRENCGIHSQNKKIPDFVFDCSTKDQELFLQTLLLGDGTRLNCNRSPSYASSSQKLLDQVQQLALSLGYSSTKSFYEKNNIGRVSIMTRKENQLNRDKSIKTVQYDGKIYCLKTNTGFYITRRKGKVAIQGNTEPTAIVILTEENNGQLKFHARVQMNKVSYSIQDKLIDWLDTRFKPSVLGVDRGSSGLAVTQRLMESDDYLHKDYDKRMIPVDFSSWVLLGFDADGEELKQKTKPFTVSVLQNYSYNHKIIYSSTDIDMVVELERMTYSKNPSGDISYKTLTPKGGQRGEDHFTSALLCAGMAYYTENESLTQAKKPVKLYAGRWIN